MNELKNKLKTATSYDILPMYGNVFCVYLFERNVEGHIHILANIHPQLGVNTFVKNLKGRSSRLLRSEFPELKTKLPTLWTNSYFVSTVSGTPLEVVKQYIENRQTSERENQRDKWSTYLENLND